MNKDANSIGEAIGRIPSGCSILTTQHKGKATGVLVSWIQQAAFKPPAVTVSLKRSRVAAELIDGSGRFVLNIIGEGSTALFKHFSKGFSLEQDAFAGLETEPTTLGPKLRDAVAHLGCEVMQKVAVGDHDLYVAKVAAGATVAGTRPYVHLRNSGLSY